MSKVMRYLLLSFATLLMIALSAYCSAYIANARTEKTAEALLRDARSLAIGESTEDDVRRLVALYGGESGGVASGLCLDNRHNV